MTKLSPQELEIVKDAGDSYTSPSRYKMAVVGGIREKLSEEDPDFTNAEMSQMFEFLASYATDKHERLIVDSLREKLKRFKFPPDGVER